LRNRRRCDANTGERIGRGAKRFPGQGPMTGQGSLTGARTHAHRGYERTTVRALAPTTVEPGQHRWALAVSKNPTFDPYDIPDLGQGRCAW